MKRALSSIKKATTLILLSVTVACSFTPEQIEFLDKNFILYEHALRWQDYDLVIGFHKNEQEKLTDVKRKELKKYRVTSYDVVYTKIEPDNMHATQVIEIKYYNDEYAVVRDLTVTNKWEYDAKKTRWQIVNPLPDFR